MSDAKPDVKRTSFTPGVILSVVVLAGVVAAAAAVAITSRQSSTVQVQKKAAADIRFAVQPIMDSKATLKAYQPLADYLSKVTGKTVELVTTNDYIDYWVRMKTGKEFNLILDAPFYTDYRIKKQNHVPLVKVPGVITNSVITRAGAGVLDVSELVGMKVATITPPSPGSLILQGQFPDASRQPILVSAKSSEEAIEMVLDGRALAAIVPTPLAGQAMSQGKDIFTVMTTPPIPHVAMTAGPDIDAATRTKIMTGLLEAAKTPEGQDILKRIGFPEGFEQATPEVYAGYSDHLNRMW